MYNFEVELGQDGIDPKTGHITNDLHFYMNIEKLNSHFEENKSKDTNVHGYIQYIPFYRCWTLCICLCSLELNVYSNVDWT